VNEPEPSSVEPIAVIGMAGRFPGADSVEALWQNLRAGVEGISRFRREELESSGVDPALLDHPDYVMAGGVLDDVDLFDAGFFGFSPRDAELLDPQQRLFLECAWQALEAAGCDPSTYPGLVGAYAGTSMSTYGLRLWGGAAEGLEVLLSNDKDYVATRTAYKLDLRGPSVTVQTACSTSLVAVCAAVQALRTYECDTALAGGVTVGVPQRQGYLYREGGIASPDGHCRPFDAAARGTVPGNGVGVVVLKRLAEALSDGDHVHAVIRGAATNNDGAGKVGFTAPSVGGQADVIALAQAQAGIAPSTIGLLEAHGTATPIGDPIEVAALAQVFGRTNGGVPTCAIGSLKSNVGHLDCAAGVAGLIKAVLAVEHAELPPSLHFETLNPEVDLGGTPFYVNTELRPWPARPAPRRAGISSFGIGGTNAHVVLEQAPARPGTDPRRPSEVLTVSARSEAALDEASQRLADHLDAHPDSDLADVAYTLHLGRRAFEQRRAVVAATPADAADLLRRRGAGTASGRTPRPVFMFSGQGSQHANMGRQLALSERAFREPLDRCCALLEPHLGVDLRGALDCPPGHEEDAAERLRQTALAQPALFAVEYALAAMWREWGVEPRALIGHSVGELVGACVAGVVTLEDAAALVAARGRLMQAMPPGAMIAVPLSEEELRDRLDGLLALAAVNAPALCAVSGPAEEIEAFAAELRAEGVACRPLRTSHAFHSALMEPAAEELTALASRMGRQPPAIPLVSNVTGRWMTDSEARDPSYWGRHLRRTVHFRDGLELLLEDQDAVLLEVGPGQTLVSLARQLARPGANVVALPSLPAPRDGGEDSSAATETLGRLWAMGLPVHWRGYHREERRRKLSLPTYPFERRRYWAAPTTPAPAPPETPPDGRVADLGNWFYVPSWVRTPLPQRVREGDLSLHPRRWLILAKEDGVGTALAARLRAEGRDVAVAVPGREFAERPDGTFTVRPGDPGDHRSLLQALDRSGRPPERVVHLLSAGPPAGLEAEQQLGLLSLVALSRALAAEQVAERLEVTVVASQMHRVLGDEPLAPARRSLIAATSGIPQEYPNLPHRCVDVLEYGTPPTPRQVDALVAELALEVADAVVAHRGACRWVQTFLPLHVAPAADGRGTIRRGDVVLITGGLGAIGLTIAEHLATTCQARVVLVGRSGLPPREEWERRARQGQWDPLARRIRAVKAIEAAGGEALVVTADVADPDAMRRAVAAATARFGAVHAVVHGAGVTSEDGFRLLAEVDAGLLEAHLRPKALGLEVLRDVLADQPVATWILLSSLSSVLGGLGFVPYAAANAYLDAVAEREHDSSGAAWMSIDWDGWDFSAEETAEQGPVPLAITPREGIEALHRLLARDPLPRVVVSTGDLFVRQAQWTPSVPPEADAADRSRHERPALAVDYAAPRDQVEQTIAGVWEGLLGIDKIGVDDDFFELGGHSLLIVQLNARLREALGVDISMQAVFEAPTVAGLAEHVRAIREQPGQASGASIRRAERVERLSEEELRALTSSSPVPGADPDAPGTP
jgi:acyl transferase domain-containing protein/acyl carrier protein